ncbi:multiple sugar transport system substrate-binding protein [Hydrogenispora ethanolica]|uniref:Multiple sugar transport system substrate-binding protein n=1 Tax=Hydrogenispora ethanolica TaxID=1082276 RepID=A0A4R1RUY8_HYDET|nr:extracellular solute-binding protein [Hydrogenispora ethanolica]TCL69920.1 multiple sugar transport system substrate-binding protein [Hydrogenispora ethanolica]
MRKVLLVLFVLVIALSLTVSALAAPKVTLRVAWWGNPTRDARTQKVIEMYMAKNPNVTIETETTGWAGYWDKLATQAAANNLPDVIQQDYAYITQYAQKNLLLDLTPAIKSKKIDLTGVSENYLSGGKVKRKYYGINLGTNAWCIVYDPAVLKKAGVAPPSPDWTWADFEALATEIYKKTGVQTMPYSTVEPRVLFQNMLRQTGKPFFGADVTKLGFNDTKVLIQFYESQLRLLKSGVLIKPETAFVTTTPQESPFAKGQSWLEFVWSNQVVAFQAAANRPVALALCPKIANSKRPGTFFKPSMFFSVTRSSANKEEAIKFINYFMNDIEANKVLLAERGIPVVPKVREVLQDMVDPVNKQVFEYISMVGKGHVSPIDPPDPPGAGEVLKAFRNIDQEVLYGTISPKDAAKKFLKQGNEILAKNKNAK